MNGLINKSSRIKIYKNIGEEMNNRSILIISLVLVSAIALSACGGQTAAANEPSAETEGLQFSPEGLPLYGCLGSAEEALVDLECREVTVAVENAYLPFNFIHSETGKAGGWDYDVIPEICERLHCQPVFIEVSWDVMIQSVADGLYDVAADGITILPEREEIADFSIGYANVEQRLLVRKGEDRFTTIEEFAANSELVMGTQTGTTNYETAIQYVPEDRVQAFEQFPFAVQALISGDVDAVIIDETAGTGYQGENADELELIGPSISSDSLGFVFPTGSALVDPFNQALQAMMADGTLEAINARYWGGDFAITYDDIAEVTYD
jgi:polar amino acid transport system substrate-binding protein